MEDYAQIQEDQENKPGALTVKHAKYGLYEEAASIKLSIEATINRRITRFIVAGLIILIENSLQMAIFYDDQLTVGNTWAWTLSAAPMLSNVLYAKWCGTIAPGLYSLYSHRKDANKIYYGGLGLGMFLCGSL